MQTKYLCELRMRLAAWRRETGLSPLVKVFFTDRSKVVLLLWIVFVSYASCLCVLCCRLSVPCSLVVTCWERADLLAVVFVLFGHFFKICPGPHQN